MMSMADCTAERGFKDAGVWAARVPQARPHPPPTPTPHPPHPGPHTLMGASLGINEYQHVAHLDPGRERCGQLTDGIPPVVRQLQHVLCELHGGGHVQALVAFNRLLHLRGGVWWGEARRLLCWTLLHSAVG